MENADVLIIGAGATGLMAAHELSKSGKKVIILEARNRIGGRIYTLNDAWHTELGAEFVHGDLPVTLQLLKEAGIEAIPASGEMWNYHDGKLSQEFQQKEYMDLLLEKLNQLKIDTTIGNFLEQEFNGSKYEWLRESVHKYVHGYDTANPFKASCFALRKEWQNEDEGAQHRVKGGYVKMIDYLADESIKNGAALFLNTIVKNIHWQHNQVEAITIDNRSYKATKLIVALPLGVLQAGKITFSPSIPQYQQAIGQMGFGAIIKILFEFKEPFWEGAKAEKLTGSDLKKMSFILSDESIPTWWTQFPENSNMLTGWLGGPPAERHKYATDEELLNQALQSLSNLFKLSILELKDRLINQHIVNWTTDPFTLGSYAYDTVEAPEARKLLNTPINYKIFFAGEYLDHGPALGTVEAALTSGLGAAKMLMVDRGQ